MNSELRIDARGLLCPKPVLETKRALDETAACDIIVLVDNAAACENVSRFARNRGCEVGVRELRSDQFEITIHNLETSPMKDTIVEELPICENVGEPNTPQCVVYIANDGMGAGDEVLGKKLIRGFLRTLIDVEPRPWRMIFINAGVRLTTLDEDSVEALAVLQEKGVDILSCGTCLEHFGLEGGLQVGRVTNMFEVIESLASAVKIISPD